MKIVIINSRYFVSGGPERYMFNLAELLEAKGHTVIPFSIQYAANLQSPYDRYFVSPLSGPEAVYYRQHSSDFRSLMKTLQRTFYAQDVFDGLGRLIEDVRPDAAIVLQYLRKLSPSVLTSLHSHGIPFVVRISDFGMVCPGAHLAHDGTPCELCIHGSLLNSVRHKCVQGSLSVSLVNYLAMRYHERHRYFDLVPSFVVPSRFTIDKMAQAGWDRRKLIHLPTFVELPPAPPAAERHGVVYVGRIEPVKGVHVLLEAVKLLRERHAISVPVRIIGTGSGEYRSHVEGFVSSNRLENVVFTGSCSKSAVLDYLSKASFSVVPSLWYDNMPNALLESMSVGTPGIVPAHGSFPEIVEHGETGLYFIPGNAADLALRMKDLLNRPDVCRKMGEEARTYVSEHHSPERHYESLMDVLAGFTAIRTASEELSAHPV